MTSSGRLLVRDATILTLDPRDRVIPRGYILVEGERIAAVGEGDPPPGVAACAWPRPNSFSPASFMKSMSPMRFSSAVDQCQRAYTAGAAAGHGRNVKRC